MSKISDVINNVVNKIRQSKNSPKIVLNFKQPTFCLHERYLLENYAIFNIPAKFESNRSTNNCLNIGTASWNDTSHHCLFKIFELSPQLSKVVRSEALLARGWDLSITNALFLRIFYKSSRFWNTITTRRFVMKVEFWTQTKVPLDKKLSNITKRLRTYKSVPWKCLLP